MGAKFRSMTEDDYYALGGFVRFAGGKDTFNQLSASLDSTTIFGRSDGYGHATQESLERLHKRGVIKLHKPVFNYVLARSNANLLWKILGVSSRTGESIIAMSLVLPKGINKPFDVSQLIPMDKVTPGMSVYMGAELAEHLIDIFDFDVATNQCLTGIVLGIMKDGIRELPGCSITKGSGDVLILGDYYISIEDAEAFHSSFKRGKTAEDFPAYVAEKVLVGCDSRITYLLNMDRDKSGLYGMISHYVAVIPPEMRPKVQNREHKLTTRYAAVITANNELAAVDSAKANLVDVQMKYQMLDKNVSKLQYKNLGTSSTVKPDDLSLLERIKSKKGQIRMRNLGKRVDYSGRAVVTVNPYLPLDMIKLPKCMLPAILEYHVLPYLVENIAKNNDSKKHGDIHSTIYDKIKLTDLRDKDAQNEILELIRKHKILDKIAIPIGRQPTLHKHGIQAFYVEISESQSIEVNPLVCPAFNMDFDGDTAYTIIPIRDKSVKEVIELVLTTHNLYLAKTGECTIEPRQDMLYGLYTATRAIYKKGTPVAEVFEDLASVREAVINHRVKCWDTVKILGGKTYLAGEAAFISCFPTGDVVARDEIPKANQLQACEITNKTISKFIDHVLRVNNNGEMVHRLGTKYASTETFVGCINHLVELGFKVAYMYTPSVSLIKPQNAVPAYDNALNEFYAEIEEYDFLYDMGFMSATDYNIDFNRVVSNLMNKMSKNIYAKLGEDNGYVLMAKSGTRGKEANLTQMFGMKGIVKKNNQEAFSALLPYCYSGQLTPMGHFVAAFGGRQGQMDKSLKTGDTGYATRQLWHATQGAYITTQDCGTHDGITVTKNYFTKFLDPDSSSFHSDLQDMFEHAIVGRYTTEGNYINMQTAKMMAKDTSIEEVTIRSPLKCKNVCCAKCYGTDWSTRLLAKVGTCVGVIAAQSLGEPMTQITMKQFQTGGVASARDITSAFDKVNAYIHCQNLAAAATRGKYSGYDPIAWDDGELKESPSSTVNEKVVRIGDNKRKKMILPTATKLRRYAVKGEGLSYKHGDYSIPEITAISGIEEAQKYLTYKLYSLYKDECNVMMCHFELLVMCMTRYMIISSDSPYFKVGQYYTYDEMIKHGTSKTVSTARLISVDELSQVSQSAMDTITMENQGRGLSRVCALGLSDDLVKPLTRITLGKSILQGSAMPGYMS